MDTRVTEVMMNMGFEWTQSHKSLRSKSYVSTIAMYLILSTKKPKVEFYIIKVRSFPFPQPNSYSPSPTKRSPHLNKHKLYWICCSQLDSVSCLVDLLQLCILDKENHKIIWRPTGPALRGTWDQTLLITDLPKPLLWLVSHSDVLGLLALVFVQSQLSPWNQLRPKMHLTYMHR